MSKNRAFTSKNFTETSPKLYSRCYIVPEIVNNSNQKSDEKFNQKSDEKFNQKRVMGLIYWVPNIPKSTEKINISFHLCDVSIYFTDKNGKIFHTFNFSLRNLINFETSFTKWYLESDDLVLYLNTVHCECSDLLQKDKNKPWGCLFKGVNLNKGLILDTKTHVLTVKKIEKCEFIDDSTQVYKNYTIFDLVRGKLIEEIELSEINLSEISIHPFDSLIIYISLLVENHKFTAVRKLIDNFEKKRKESPNFTIRNNRRYVRRTTNLFTHTTLLDGITILHIASRIGNLSLIKYLLKNGAIDVIDMKNNQGISSYDIVKFYNYRDIMKVFNDHLSAIQLSSLNIE